MPIQLPLGWEKGLALSRHCEAEILRVLRAKGPEAARHASLMVANRMLTNLYAIVGFEAAMTTLQQMHDAVERALVIHSYTDGSRSRSAADAEMERIGVKAASRLPAPPPRPMPGEPLQLPKPGQAPRRNNDDAAGLARLGKQKRPG